MLFQVERGITIGRHEDHAVALFRRQADQAAVLAPYLRKALRAGHADELAFDVVDPSVEGAGESTGSLSATRVDDANAPVLAYVQQGADLALLIPGDDDRRPVASNVIHDPGVGRSELKPTNIG